MSRLVVTRKTGESIKAGEAVITIEKIVGNKVSVAIEAPRDVPVDRLEIAEQKQSTKDIEQEQRLVEQRERQALLDAEYWNRRGF